MLMGEQNHHHNEWVQKPIRKTINSFHTYPNLVGYPIFSRYSSDHRGWAMQAIRAISISISIPAIASHDNVE